MISLRTPHSSSESGGWEVKRSSAVMSGHLDRAFWAVGRGPAGRVLEARRYHAVPQDLPVAFFVVAEELGGEVVAAAVPLAALRIYPHLHCGAPVWCRGIGVT